MAVAGLAEKEVDPEEEVFCPGYYRLGRRTYRCWKRGGHGAVNLEQALVHSCDVYFYQLGVKLGIDRIARYAKAFGLSHLTGIDLPGEQAGLVPTREWKQRVKHEPWQKGETVSVAIGQGANLVTPMQLAVAFAAIANGGTRVEPRLVRRLETWDGQPAESPEPPGSTRVGVSPEVLARVSRALTGVVQQPRGTGGRARVRGVEVAGKTGTTQVVSLDFFKDLERDEIPLRYRDHALFAAYAPAAAPEIVVAVVVDHAGAGGGTVAAPIAQKVLARYFEKQEERLASLPVLGGSADAEPGVDGVVEGVSVAGD
jgi:penicillin-binding protein 2